MGKVIKYGIAVVVVAAIGFLFYSGALSKDDAEQIGRSAYYKTKGTAAKVLDSNPIGKGTYADANKCRENLHEIEQGKRLVAQRKGAAVGAVSEEEVSLALGKPFPKCPVGGRYTMRGLEFLPVCSIGDNTTLDPKDDHYLKQY